MVSGAGHDAMIMAEKVPSAMIFLRTPGGISHAPEETVEIEDVAKALESGLHLLDLLASSQCGSKEKHDLQNLGGTRSSQQPSHLLLTADTFVRAPLPGMKGCTAIVHVGPALGAAFTQYTAEFEAGGVLGRRSAQRFIFVMEGGVKVEAEGKQTEMVRAAMRISRKACRIESSRRRASRVAVIEKPYQPLASADGAALDYIQRRCRHFNAARRRSGLAGEMPASGLDELSISLSTP